MKRYNAVMAITAIAATMLTLFASCSAITADAQKTIDKYCELNSKEHNAAGGSEKEATSAEKKAYEKEVDDKYFKDNKTYQIILDGMKKCDEAFAVDAQAASPAGGIATEDELLAMLSLAYKDAATSANTYCTLTDQSIAAAKTETDTELKRIVSAKMMFEHKMEDSYKNNTERRDSILKLIEPCLKTEVQFSHNNQ